MNENSALLREMEHDGQEFLWNGIALFRYIARSEVPADECPKPYFHPLRNLHGDVITNHRPRDHRWHHGLSMTMTLVSGTNFWGGATYRKGDGYRMRGNIGSQDHIEWLEKCVGERSVRLVERVLWNNENRVAYFDERREIHAEVFPDVACWRLQLHHEFENVSGKALRLGTYESEEENVGAHYTGLFLRMGRDFLSMGEHEVFGARLPDGQHGVDAIHGTSAPWMTCTGGHDNSSAITTLICCDHPENPNYPVRWFYRPRQPSIGMPFVSSKSLVMGPSERLRLRHTLLFADGAVDTERAAAILQACT